MTKWKAKEKNFTEGELHEKGAVIVRDDKWLPPMKGKDESSSKWERISPKKDDSKKDDSKGAEAGNKK